MHHFAAVTSLVVLQANTGLACLIVLNEEGNAELRSIGFESLDIHWLSLVRIAVENSHLVGKHDFCRKVVVGSDACKRVSLMAQSLVEILAGLIQELLDALFTNLGTQCQCVDKHSHRIADAQVRTSVTDGGDTQLLVVCEAGQCVEGGGKDVMRRRDVFLTTEILYGVKVQRSKYGTNGALFKRIGKIRRNLCHTLHLSQTLLEEIAGSSIFLTAFGSFLRSYKVCIGEGLGLDLLAVKQVKQLRQKYVVRTAVHYEVMNIHHQIHPLIGGDNLYMVERSLTQVKRLDEIPLVAWNICLIALAIDNFDRLCSINNLYDLRARTAKMRL